MRCTIAEQLDVFKPNLAWTLLLMATCKESSVDAIPFLSSVLQIAELLKNYCLAKQYTQLGGLKPAAVLWTSGVKIHSLKLL